MRQRERIEFIKEMVSLEEDEESVALDGPRSQALKFLNALEIDLHKKFMENNGNINVTQTFEQIFKAREFLRQPGSPVKNLLDSVALSIPNF